MAVSNSSCPSLWPMPYSCSNNGYCTTLYGINTSFAICECKSGFSSLGDFSTQYEDCDIHILTVRILYGIGILASLVNATFLILKLFLPNRVQMFFQSFSKSSMLSSTKMMAMMNSADNDGKGPSPHKLSIDIDTNLNGKKLHSFFCLSLPRLDSTNGSLNVLGIGGLMCSFFVTLFCIVKVYDPVQFAVGYNFFPTFFLGCTYWVFWTATAMFMYSFADLTVKQTGVKGIDFKRKVEKRMAFFKKSLLLDVALSFVLAFCPLLSLVIPNSVRTFASVHYLGAAFNIAFLGFFLITIVVKPIRDDIRLVLKELGYKPGEVEKSVEAMSPNDRIGLNHQIALSMDKSQAKLTFAIHFVYNNAFQQFIINIVFGVWPFFIRKASYQLPVTWSIAQIIICVLVYNIAKFGKKKQIKHPASPLVGVKFEQVISQESKIIPPALDPIDIPESTQDNRT